MGFASACVPGVAYRCWKMSPPEESTEEHPYLSWRPSRNPINQL
jgi:hypothetical protein